MIRIISGRWRGKLLQTLPGQHTRPTADRTRQALFNVLEHNPEFLARSSGFLSVWQNLVVIDGFAGSGALGLEALSRGADQAYFFEQHSEATRIIQQNIKQLSVQDKSRLYPGNILNPPLLSTQSGLIPAHLVFLDPPITRILLSPPCSPLKNKAGCNQTAVSFWKWPRTKNYLFPPPTVGGKKGCTDQQKWCWAGV